MAATDQATASIDAASVPDIAGAVECARRAFSTGRTKDLAWRRRQLEALIRMLQESSDQIEAAVHADLGKAPVETYGSEVGAVITEARAAIKHLRSWTRDRPVRGSLLRVGTSRASVRREPLGTVLIIGPWNYPLHLLLMPLIGAIAAGNTVVLKPSELAPACSHLVATVIPRYLDPEAIVVVEGAVPETTQLLEQRFDHIFYTGNGPVGSIVMAAAAKHLTPVTLELGGKSPVWVDPTASLEVTAEKIAWGKFANAGQTCVAPDYVLTTPAVAPKLAEAIAAATLRMYGEDPRKSNDFGRIVNSRHAERLGGLLGSGRAVMGGIVDPERRYVAPTVLLDVEPDAPIMQQEIFGPILPIVVVPDVDAAIEFVNAREKPLALYVFSQDQGVRSVFLDRTSSGGLVFNSVMIHLGVSGLPFGGVGASGMGAYHGERSVETFSHEKAILQKLRGFDLTRLAHPPYTPQKQRMLRRS